MSTTAASASLATFHASAALPDGDGADGADVAEHAARSASGLPPGVLPARGVAASGLFPGVVAAHGPFSGLLPASGDGGVAARGLWNWNLTSFGVFARGGVGCVGCVVDKGGKSSSQVRMPNRSIQLPHTNQ